MRSSAFLGAVALFASLASSVQAQGWIDPIHPPIPNQTGRVERLRSAVQVSISGRVARVTVEEWFRNNGPALEEGMYHFPLPGEAVFSSYSLWQGDQELRGEAMDATQARSIYEAIVRQKRDPALIELAGEGLIRARVFPIAPGETRKITLKYTQLLDRAGDAWRFRYLGDRNRQSAPRSFRLEVDSAARFGDPYSPTHQVQMARQGDHIEVTLGDNTAGGDFELLLPLARGLVGLSLIPHHPAGEDGYFMMLLAPGAAADANALRRDVVAVIDVSGSMSGEKLAQAKAALTQLLGSLRQGDRFRLVAFSGGVRRFASGWTTVAADGRQAASEWIQSLEAEGGTNIAGALSEAFAQSPDEQALGVVVFLTDGQASTGETDPERIAQQAEQGRGRFRVFSFGIGDDVNTYLLDRLTERARGTTEYIRPGENIERAVGTLAAKIASPVLTDIAISAGSAIELYDVQPGNLPDLFAGDELVLFGRYRGAGSGEQSVTVRGRRNGRQEEFTTTFADRENDDARYIEQLWAARKVGALSRDIRLHGQTREIMDALKQLALRYGILTEYTSYLVQEPNVALRRQFEDRVMQAPAPAPSAQAGAGSVSVATRDRSMAESDNLAAAQEQMRGDLSGFDATRRAHAGINPTQRVGGRLFILRDSTWTDLGHGDSLHVVSIAPYSDAYFALLKALPDLREAAALEPSVLVAGRRASIKIGAGGKTTFNPGELERLVREFRS
ncbi:MAG TPA: VIT domain-containing protein [Gemmatimonadales bacterium]|nr:VIT domain-containing protein [Gemmatimonadales bacterium]